MHFLVLYFTAICWSVLHSVALYGLALTSRYCIALYQINLYCIVFIALANLYSAKHRTNRCVCSHCLTTLRHKEDDQRRPPHLSVLWTGITRRGEVWTTTPWWERSRERNRWWPTYNNNDALKAVQVEHPSKKRPSLPDSRSNNQSSYRSWPLTEFPCTRRSKWRATDRHRSRLIGSPSAV